MNLRSDRRQNIQGDLDFSTADRGEVRETGREETESLQTAHEAESPASRDRWMEEFPLSRAFFVIRELLAQPTRTAVYGTVCTVVWEGRGCKALPYPDRQ